MGRLVTLVACALLALFPFLLPEGDLARLAALDAHLLLQEPAGEPLPGGGEPPTVAAVLLDSAACTHFEGERAGEAEFVLTGATVEGAPLGHASANDLRRSIVRGLRQEAQAQGLELQFVGELLPHQTRVGANFWLLDPAEPGLRLRFLPPGASETQVFEMDWQRPRRTSIVPPVVAILLAILLRRPVLALFVGVLAGSVLVARAGGAGPGGALAEGAWDVARVYFWSELVDPERAMIIAFVVFMLAMVGIMTRSGGIQGTMDLIARAAGSVRSTQVATWLMGLLIFFDDYANTILVGSTMRPLTDRFRIAREKLAYIVDSTAAPVAGLAIFSTWIAFQVSTFSAQLPAAGLASTAGYEVVIETLPYRFYCILTLLFVGLVALTGRDFGPMRRAEERARREGRLVSATGKPMVSEEATAMQPAPGVRPRAHRAVLPVLTFIAVTLATIAWNGIRAMRAAGWEGGVWTAEGVREMLYEGSGSQPLMLGSLAGLALAVLFGVAAGMGRDLFDAAWKTLRSLGIAVAILYLAWMIGAVCGDLGTAPYLTALLSEEIDPNLLPVLLFLLGGAVAFATGSSWSTMSILLPLVVVLAFDLGDRSALGGHLLMVICIGAVFEGAIFGDHCSPISDTTVLSSIASASDHIDHVRTQVPYAVLTMLTAMAFGYLPCTYLGWSPWMGLGLGALFLVGALLLLGRRTPQPPTPQPPNPQTD